jgi:hypothetical protein
LKQTPFVLMISKGFLIHTQSLRLGLFLNQYRVVGNYRDGLLKLNLKADTNKSMQTQGIDVSNHCNLFVLNLFVLNLLCTRCTNSLHPYRAFAHDVTAAMLVFQFKRILIRLFCLKHQHGRHAHGFNC